MEKAIKQQFDLMRYKHTRQFKKYFYGGAGYTGSLHQLRNFQYKRFIYSALLGVYEHLLK